jgi:hypothetical protein
MAALWRWLVHLDHVFEAGHSLPERGFAKQVVERREEDGTPSSR